MGPEHLDKDSQVKSHVSRCDIGQEIPTIKVLVECVHVSEIAWFSATEQRERLSDRQLAGGGSAGPAMVIVGAPDSGVSIAKSM